MSDTTLIKLAKKATQELAQPFYSNLCINASFKTTSFPILYNFLQEVTYLLEKENLTLDSIEDLDTRFKEFMKGDRKLLATLYLYSYYLWTNGLAMYLVYPFLIYSLNVYVFLFRKMIPYCDPSTLESARSKLKATSMYKKLDSHYEIVDYFVRNVLKEKIVSSNDLYTRFVRIVNLIRQTIRALSIKYKEASTKY